MPQRPRLRRPAVAGGFWWWFGVSAISQLAAAFAFGAEINAAEPDAQTLLLTGAWLLASGIVTTLLGLRLDAQDRASWRAAEFDELTGVTRRGPLVAALRERLDAPPTGISALCMVDLDQFRRLNDAVGHGAADRFLRALAERIQDACAAGDVVGRTGDDEFAVVLTRTDVEAVAATAQQIVDNVGRPCLVGDLRATVTASIGVVLLDGVAAEDALRRGLLALQAAKRAGGDTVRWFTADLEVAALRAEAWQVRLSEAIHDEAFESAFQPIVDAHSGGLVGAEALVRLVADDSETVAGAFVEHAEATGQVIAMGRIARRHLAAQLPTIFAAAPPGFRVHLNLSVKELGDADSVEQFRESPLAMHADRLVVEVTESFELSASQEAKEHLRQLGALGYHIALDDFGSGFSNFVQLEELGFELIKVDRTLLVRAGRGNRNSVAVLQAAVAVARTLGSRLIAEGVETDEQLQLARELGFDFLQGFGVARPMPLPHLLDALAGRSA